MDKKIASAFGYKFLERICVQGTSFIVTLLLARIISAEEYGLVSLIMVFVSLANTFVQGGFNTALIRKKEISENDYFSVLCFSLGIALILYIVLFFASDYLEMYFSMQGFSKLIRCMGIILFFGAVNSVQVAKATRELKMKVLTYCSLLSSALGAFVGLSMAWHEFGAWALVAQQVVSQLTTCVAYFLITKWFPHGKFSIDCIKELIPFGSRVLCSNLLVALFLDLRSLIIGRVYDSGSLGYFNRGKQFPQAIMESINGTIQSILLPIYAKEQSDPHHVVQMARKTIRLSTYLIFPILIGLACVAPSLVTVLLTDKWLPCVPFLQIFCISYMVQPIQISSAQIYKALGNSKIPLHMEILRKSIELLLLVVSLNKGTLSIAYSTIASGVLGLVISMIYNRKYLQYSFSQQIGDIFPALFLSIAMAIPVQIIDNIIINPLVCLIVQVIVGIIVYLAASILFRNNSFKELVRYIKNKGELQ